VRRTQTPDGWTDPPLQQEIVSKQAPAACPPHLPLVAEIVGHLAHPIAVWLPVLPERREPAKVRLQPPGSKGHRSAAAPAKPPHAPWRRGPRPSCSIRGCSPCTRRLVRATVRARAPHCSWFRPPPRANAMGGLCSCCSHLARPLPCVDRTCLALPAESLKVKGNKGRGGDPMHSFGALM